MTLHGAGKDFFWNCTLYTVDLSWCPINLLKKQIVDFNIVHVDVKLMCAWDGYSRPSG